MDRIPNAEDIPMEDLGDLFALDGMREMDAIDSTARGFPTNALAYEEDEEDEGGMGLDFHTFDAFLPHREESTLERDVLLPEAGAKRRLGDNPVPLPQRRRTEPASEVGSENGARGRGGGGRSVRSRRSTESKRKRKNERERERRIQVNAEFDNLTSTLETIHGPIDPTGAKPEKADVLRQANHTIRSLYQTLQDLAYTSPQIRAILERDFPQNSTTAPGQCPSTD